MRIAFALSGLHRVDRGAEIAFMAVGHELALRGHDVTLFGSGEQRPDKAYRFVHVPTSPRERFEKMPHFPMFRDETAYEEFSFARALRRVYRSEQFDIAGGCTYPFVNWTLRRGRNPRTKVVFITQNGDYPAWAAQREYRFFGCDGLVCINPDFFAKNQHRWTSALIPNGVDTEKFRQARGDRAAFGLPENRKIVLMVSALIASKRVDKAIETVAKLPDVHLAVAGDGPERERIAGLAALHLPGRFTRMTLAPQQMPALYHSADAFLHMSQAEAFGNVYIEALASGLPVVAHDIARHRWVVGDTGFFVDTDDAAATARHLKSALNSPETERKKRTAFVEKYDWHLIGSQYEAFFNRLLEGPTAT